MEGAKCNCGKQGPDGLMLRGGLDYTIPEGHEAVIEGCKVIVRKKESEDERAKRSILRLIEAFHDVNFPTPEGFSREDLCAWVNSYKTGYAQERALSFIEYLDKNSYAGKMCVSNPECEDIVNAFIEKDWAKLVAYANKYLRGAAEGRTAPLSSKCQEWIDAVECVAGAFPPGSKGYDMVIGSIHDLIKYLKSPCLENRMWSKEDDKMIDRIMGAVTGYHTHRSTQDTDEMMDWLRDLRRNPRPMASKPNYCHHEVDETGWTEEYRKAYYDGWNNCNQQHAQLEATRFDGWSKEDKERYISCLQILGTGNPDQPETVNSKWFKEHLSFFPHRILCWSRARAGENIPESIIIPDGEEPRFGKCAVKDSYYIPISELKKLPVEL